MTAKKKNTKPKSKTSTTTKATKKESVATTPKLKSSDRDLAEKLAPAVDTSTITIKKSYAVAFGVVLVGFCLVAAYMANQWLVVAHVNGSSISRLDYIREMEAKVGDQTMNELITEELIWQQANSQGISVPAEEIDAEIEEIRASMAAQGQELEQLLAMQGMTENQLREQIVLQRLLTTLAGVDETIDEEELTAYIEANRDFFPDEMTEEELDRYARDRYLAENNQDLIQNYLQQLRMEANIRYSNM